jgi:hypothetical protein
MMDNKFRIKLNVNIFYNIKKWSLLMYSPSISMPPIAEYKKKLHFSAPVKLGLES